MRLFGGSQCTPTGVITRRGIWPRRDPKDVCAPGGVQARTQGEGGRLQAKEGGLRRRQTAIYNLQGPDCESKTRRFSRLGCGVLSWQPE